MADPVLAEVLVRRTWFEVVGPNIRSRTFGPGSALPRPLSRRALFRRERAGRPVGQAPLASGMRGSGWRPGASFEMRICRCSQSWQDNGREVLSGNGGRRLQSDAGRKIALQNQNWQLSLRSSANGPGPTTCRRSCRAEWMLAA
eukprot:364939-Chlamydomonas_euryale.AAC.4